MNIELKLSLSRKEKRLAAELISGCNKEDGTRYEREIDGDFFYLSWAETSGSAELDGLLYGYLLGETLGGEEMLEIYAFTKPAFRRMGIFTSCLNSLRDDFRNFHYRLAVKASKPTAPAEDGIAPSAAAALCSVSAIHQYDELFMEKELERGIQSPGAILEREYGRVQFSRYNEETLYLYGLLVYESFRGKGFGRRILTEVERLSQDGPYKKILLQVRSDNKAGCELYCSMGYKVTERIAYYLLP